jgi:hypothetical protein
LEKIGVIRSATAGCVEKSGDLDVGGGNWSKGGKSTEVCLRVTDR